MKRIKYDRIKAGDYVKVILTDEQYNKNKAQGYDFWWKSCYFQVVKINESNDLQGNLWIDFDYKDLFLRVIKENETIEGNGGNVKHFYILTEEEYLKKCGKYIITSSWEENERNKRN